MVGTLDQPQVNRFIYRLSDFAARYPPLDKLIKEGVKLAIHCAGMARILGYEEVHEPPGVDPHGPPRHAGEDAIRHWFSECTGAYTNGKNF